MAKTAPNECPAYDIKSSGGKEPYLEIWGTQVLFYCRCSQIHVGSEW